MKRSLLLIPLGLLAGVLAFGASFWFQTRNHRNLAGEQGAELEWLRHEFHLTDAQFARVADLHNAYQPRCSELCQRIADRNQRLREAVARTNTVTEEIRALVTETGQARDACRQAMLGHLYAVAREMPPEAGQRYLQLMLGATCVLQETRTIGAVQADAQSGTGTRVASPHSRHE